MSKVTFWQKLFGGATATTETAQPVADATGAVGFSAEQFGTLTALLESLEDKQAALIAKETAYTELETRFAALEKVQREAGVTLTAHAEKFAKLKLTPGAPIAGTTIEPTTMTGDVETVVAESEVAKALREAQATGGMLTVSL